ncbi:hypothetical protein ABTM12_19900, partial [Acinetobacter baumannii]
MRSIVLSFRPVARLRRRRWQLTSNDHATGWLARKTVVNGFSSVSVTDGATIASGLPQPAGRSPGRLQSPAALV